MKRQLSPEEGKFVRKLNPAARKWAMQLLQAEEPFDKEAIEFLSEEEGKQYRKWLNDNIATINKMRPRNEWTKKMSHDISIAEFKKVLIDMESEYKSSKCEKKLKIIMLMKNFERSVNVFTETVFNSITAGDGIIVALKKSMQSNLEAAHNDFEDRLFCKQTLHHIAEKIRLKTPYRQEILHIALDPAFITDDAIRKMQVDLAGAITSEEKEANETLLSYLRELYNAKYISEKEIFNDQMALLKLILKRDPCRDIKIIMYEYLEEMFQKTRIAKGNTIYLLCAHNWISKETYDLLTKSYPVLLKCGAFLVVKQQLESIMPTLVSEESKVYAKKLYELYSQPVDWSKNY